MYEPWLYEICSKKYQNEFLRYISIVLRDLSIENVKFNNIHHDPLIFKLSQKI